MYNHIMHNSLNAVEKSRSRCAIRGDPFITFAERGRGGVKKFDQNANAVREVAGI